MSGEQPTTALRQDCWCAKYRKPCEYHEGRADGAEAAEAERDAAQESANKWAYKFTLLALWVRENCTPEQADAARAWIAEATK